MWDSGGGFELEDLSASKNDKTSTNSLAGVTRKTLKLKPYALNLEPTLCFNAAINSHSCELRLGSWISTLGPE